MIKWYEIKNKITGGILQEYKGGVMRPRRFYNRADAVQYLMLCKVRMDCYEICAFVRGNRNAAWRMRDAQ